VRISSVQVTCSPITLAISGTIAGLSGAGLVVQNNGADDLSLAANATSFQFATPVAYDGAYAVTVRTQPAGQSCSVANGAGTATSSVADVAVTCTNIPTHTITASGGANGSIAPSGAISVNIGDSQGFVATPEPNYAVLEWLIDGTPVQSGGTVFTLSNISADHTVEVTFGQTALMASPVQLALAVNGTQRTFLVTNVGLMQATNVSVSSTSPSLAMVISAATCGSVLPSNATCAITITPGPLATSGCTSGIEPTPDIITVSADDAPSINLSVLVLDYDCIYQGGYVFAIDDTTPDTSSIGGKVAATTDQAAPFPNGIIWSSNGTGRTPADVNYTAIGVDEASIAPCRGATDGACNSTVILSMYSSHPPQYYAAGLCTAAISGYSDWYLPSICELGTSVSACGVPSATDQNMQSSLVDAYGLNLLSGIYWSSTEGATAPQLDAWFHTFAPGGGAAQGMAAKNTELGTRCVRALTP
jgi:hypothetical protein